MINRIELLLTSLREQNGILYQEYSAHNFYNLKTIGEAEEQGFVKTEIIEHYDDQFTEIKVILL